MKNHHDNRSEDATRSPSSRRLDHLQRHSGRTASIGLVTQPTEVGSPPLVGRQDELERIAQALARPTCRGVALIGPAGVGKTRLADKCRKLAETAGMAVLAATANATSARFALGSVAHLLPPPSGLADVHQDLQPTQLLQSARESLEARAGGRPLVISIDDAHHLDEVAAHLINHLATTNVAFVVLTVRSGEVVPASISALWKDGFVERVDLEALRWEDTGKIATALLGAPLDNAATTWLSRTSSGNALFLRELVLAGREDGTLKFEQGIWRMTTGSRPESPRLIELVEQRLEGLSNEERRAVEIIALAEPIGLEVIEALVGIDCLEALDRRGLVRIVADNRRLGIALTHPLYAESLKRGPLTLRKRADLGAVANALNARGARRREDPVRIAGWQLARGGRADPEVIFRAALAAQLNFDDHSAIELASAGLAQDPVPFLRAELHLCRALAHMRHGRFRVAQEDLRDANALETTSDQTSRIAVLLAAALVEQDGDLAGAVRVLDVAISRLKTEPERLNCRLERATLLADSGQPRAAREELDRIGSSPLAVEQQILFALASESEHLSAGRPDSAIVAADRGLHLHLSNSTEVTTYHPLSHFLPRIFALLDGGELQRVETEGEWIRERGESDRRPMAVTCGRIFVVLAVLRRGRPRSALALARAAMESASVQMQAYMVRIVWAVLAQAHAMLGEREAALAALREIDTRRGVVDGFGAIEVLLASARVAQVCGDANGSSTGLWTGVRDAQSIGNLRVVFAGLDELVHVHADHDAARLLIELAASGEGRLLGVRVAQAAALLGPPAHHVSSMGAVAECFSELV